LKSGSQKEIQLLEYKRKLELKKQWHTFHNSSLHVPGTQ
jgi:hypothetical protein